MQERYQLHELSRLMATARTYEGWLAAATKHEDISGAGVARALHFDERYIDRTLGALRELRRTENVGAAGGGARTPASCHSRHCRHRLPRRRLPLVCERAVSIAHSLRCGLHRNLAGIANPLNYSHVRARSELLDAYIGVVVDGLSFIARGEFPEFSAGQRLVFLAETVRACVRRVALENVLMPSTLCVVPRPQRHAFGSTALLLSGGASLTMLHLGVIKALHEQGLLPRVISGSSGGALVAAYVCCKPDASLGQIFQRGGMCLYVPLSEGYQG